MNKKRFIDGSFVHGGIDYSQIVFSHDGNSTKTKGLFTKVENKNLRPDAEHTKELIGETAIEQSGAVEYRTFNKQASPEDGAIVVLQGAGNHIRTQAALCEVITTAEADAYHRQVIMINNSAKGNSAPFPTDILHDAKDSGGRFSMLANWLCKNGFDDVLDKYDLAKSKIVGNSAGACMAAGMAAVRPFGEVRLMEPVNLQRQLMASLAIKFARSGKDIKNSYIHSPYNDNLPGRLPDGVSGPKSNWVPESLAEAKTLLGLVDVMSRGGLERDLTQALPNIKHNLTVATAEESYLTDSVLMNEMLGGLAVHSALSSNDIIICQDVIHRQSHTILSDEAGAAPLAAIYNLPILLAVQ